MKRVAAGKSCVAVGNRKPLVLVALLLLVAVVTSACGSSAQEGPGLSEPGEAPLGGGVSLPEGDGLGAPQGDGAAQTPPGAAEGADNSQGEEGVFNLTP